MKFDTFKEVFKTLGYGHLLVIRKNIDRFDTYIESFITSTLIRIDNIINWERIFLLFFVMKNKLEEYFYFFNHSILSFCHTYVKERFDRVKHSLFLFIFSDIHLFHFTTVIYFSFLIMNRNRPKFDVDFWYQLYHMFQTELIHHYIPENVDQPLIIYCSGAGYWQFSFMKMILWLIATFIILFVLLVVWANIIFYYDDVIFKWLNNIKHLLFSIQAKFFSVFNKINFFITSTLIRIDNIIDWERIFLLFFVVKNKLKEYFSFLDHSILLFYETYVKEWFDRVKRVRFYIHQESPFILISKMIRSLGSFLFLITDFFDTKRLLFWISLLKNQVEKYLYFIYSLFLRTAFYARDRFKEIFMKKK